MRSFYQAFTSNTTVIHATTQSAKFLFILVFFLLQSACVSIIDATTDGPIQEDSGERTFGNTIDDERIETVVLVNLRKASETLKNAHINAISYNGVVLLVGQVNSSDDRALAAEVAGQVRGVRLVHNELTASGKISGLAITNDSWLTTKVKSKLMINGKTDSGRIKVVTENGVVYLMGLLTRAEAQHAVEAIQNTGGIQKIVRVFEYID